MLPDDRNNLIDTNFTGLLGKPFIAVRILCRADGKYKTVRMAPPVRDPLHYLSLGPFGRILCNTAAHKGSLPVYHKNLIPGLMPQDLYTMPRFISTQTTEFPVNIFRIKYLHF